MSEVFYANAQNLQTTCIMEFRKALSMPGYPVQKDLVMGIYG